MNPTKTFPKYMVHWVYRHIPPSHQVLEVHWLTPQALSALRATTKYGVRAGTLPCLSGWVSGYLAKAPGAQHRASVMSLEEGWNTGFLVWDTNWCKSTGLSWVTCCTARTELQHILQSSAAWSSQHWAPWCAGTAAVGPPCKLRRPKALVQALASDHFYSLNVQTVLDSNLAHAS